MNWPIAILLAIYAVQIVEGLNPCNITECSCSEDTLLCRCNGTAMTLPRLDLRSLPTKIESYNISNCPRHTISSRQLAGKAFKRFYFNNIRQLTFMNNTFVATAIDSIKVSNSKVYIFKNAFQRVGLIELVFERSEVGLLADDAITESILGHLNFTHSNIPLLGRFQRATSITEVTICRSNINILETHALMFDQPVERIEIIFSNINTVQQSAIRLNTPSNSVSEVTIHYNTFQYVNDSFITYSSAVNRSFTMFYDNRFEIMQPNSLGGLDGQRADIAYNRFGLMHTVTTSPYFQSNNIHTYRNRVSCSPQLCYTLRLPLVTREYYNLNEKLLFETSYCEENDEISPYSVYSRFNTTEQCIMSFQ